LRTVFFAGEVDGDLLARGFAVEGGRASFEYVEAEVGRAAGCASELVLFEEANDFGAALVGSLPC